MFIRIFVLLFITFYGRFSAAITPCDCACSLSSLSVVDVISEDARVGFSVFNTTWTSGTNISLKVLEPRRLAKYLTPYFMVLENRWGTLQRPFDVETIYVETEIKLYYIVISILCHRIGEMEEKRFNITIEDIDDNEPTFTNAQSEGCILTGYKAKADQKYMGVLETEPGSISAADGDVLINNSISYSLLYGEPRDYYKYFEISASDGSVNKTANVTDNEPQDFVLLIKATEISTASKSKVAVLSVTMTTMVTTETPIVTVDHNVLLVLRIASGVIILGFTAAFAVIIRHRMRKYWASKKTHPDPDIRSLTSPRFADLELVKEDSFLKENTIILTDSKVSETVLSVNNIDQ